MAEALSDGFGGAELIRGHLDRLPEMWDEREAFVFVMSTGIVVRVIAPLVNDKNDDPAVVAMDEKGEFAVPLLSGHLGGANELARKAADITGGNAVITTASDVNGFPAIDTMAQDLGLVIENSRAISSAAAALLNGDGLVIYSDISLGAWESRFKRAGAELRPLSHWRDAAVGAGYLEPPESYGELAGNYREFKGSGRKKSVLITEKAIESDGELILRPKCLWVGVGCRRGVSKEEVLSAVERAARKAGVSSLSIAGMATIDRKAGEVGMIEAAAELGVRVRLYSASELKSAIVEMRKAHLAPRVSSFAEEKVGVGSVCEAASMLASDMGALLLPKEKFGRVTIAVAKADWRS